MGLFSRKPKDLEPGTAIVVFSTLTPKAMRQTGKRDLDHEVKLQVRRPEGDELEVTMVCEVPYDKPLTVGSEVPVRLSRTDPDFVEIDFGGVRSLEEVGRAAVNAARSGQPFDVVQEMESRPEEPGR